MTSFLPPSRALSHQLVSRVPYLRATQRSCARSWSRVTFNHKLGYLSYLLQSNASPSILGQLLSRSYATKPGKPKAHTGRVAASKRKPAAAQSDAAAGVPKKAPAKKTATATAKKPATKKSAAKRPARKAKSAPDSKPKPRRRIKIPTEKQILAKEKKDAGNKKKDLQKVALLDHPKQLPATAYTVLSVENSSKGKSITQHSRELSAQYKNLSPEEMEVDFVLLFESGCALTYVSSV